MQVSVGRMPGSINQVDVAEGGCVNDVLGAAGLHPDGFSVRRDGEEVNLDAPVAEGQTILLVRKVKGNMSLAQRARIIRFRRR